MLLVLSITFNFHYNTWGWRCSTGPFQYRWLKGYIYSSCYYHHRKYPAFPLSSYFSMVVCLRCFLHHILSLIAYTFWENREFVFISIVQFMLSANIQIHFGWQIVLVCLYSTPSHYHHCANLSEGIELIKCLSRYILSSVWVRLSIFSLLSIIQYMGLYVFSLSISLGMTKRIYILCLIIIIKSEVWTITHCLGLGHETMVSAVCLSIFFYINYGNSNFEKTIY